jgi:hypothetical protein
MGAYGHPAWLFQFSGETEGTGKYTGWQGTIEYAHCQEKREIEPYTPRLMYSHESAQASSLCGKAGRLTYAGLAGHAGIEGIIEPYRLVRGRK